ncbi:BlaI/MecI/CopY family transcriptional regulator, partial [Listeria monocytogenes]|nr:BlaI/MecI/CopY family transcriptional regulator [Listeria monocytogenes]
SPDELEDLQQFWKRMKSPNE